MGKGKKERLEEKKRQVMMQRQEERRAEKEERQSQSKERRKKKYNRVGSEEYSILPNAIQYLKEIRMREYEPTSTHGICNVTL